MSDTNTYVVGVKMKSQWIPVAGGDLVAIGTLSLVYLCGFIMLQERWSCCCIGLVTFSSWVVIRCIESGSPTICIRWNSSFFFSTFAYCTIFFAYIPVPLVGWFVWWSCFHDYGQIQNITILFVLHLVVHPEQKKRIIKWSYFANSSNVNKQNQRSFEVTTSIDHQNTKSLRIDLQRYQKIRSLYTF